MLYCPNHEKLVELLDDTHPVDETIVEHVDRCKKCQSVLDSLTDFDRKKSYQPGVRRINDANFFWPAEQETDLGTLEGLAVEEQIGLGGMGVVYRGRDLKLGRPVAIKLLKPTSNEKAIERFEREANAAGRLRHDHLVTVYSCGRAKDGSPYMVMPLIEGKSLKERIYEGHLPVRESAELVRQIAAGLSLAHAKGLIHRDVKPANILLDDSDHRAKLTDFGLVRTLDDTTLTQADVICGTPEYISPEQFDAPNHQDHRCDIYGLGITLYHCLTGTTPFRGLPMDVLEQHRSEDPVPPSRLNSLVPRDLETICLKAISKKPDQRYATAMAMADDLGSWLDGDPIVARPPSSIERLARYVGKHKGLVASMAAILLTLAIAAVTSTLFALKSNESLARSEKRLEIVVDSLKSSNPQNGALAGMTAKDMLVSIQANIEPSLVDDPEGKATILLSLGDSLRGLGEYDLATTAYEDSLKYFEQSSSMVKPKLLAAKRSLGTIYMESDRMDEAKEILTSVRDAFQEMDGANSVETLVTQGELVNWHDRKGDFKTAIEIGESVLSQFEASIGFDKVDTVRSARHLATAYQSADRMEDAKDLTERILQVYESLGESDDYVAIAQEAELALIYSELGDLKEAIRRGDAALGRARKHLPEHHPAVSTMLANLSTFHAYSDNLEEAADYALKSWSGSKYTFGEDSLEAAEAQSLVASVYYLQQKTDESIELMESALEIQKKSRGVTHDTTMSYMNNLAVMYSNSQRMAKAIGIAREIVASATEALGPKHDTTLNAQGNLAVFLMRHGEHDEGIALHSDLLNKTSSVRGPDHPDTLSATMNQGSMLMRYGQPEEAIEFLETVTERHRRVYGIDHWRTLHGMTELAKAYGLAKRFDDSIKLFDETLALGNEHLGAEHAVVDGLLTRFAKVLRKSNRFDRAREIATERLETYVNSKGENHRETLDARYNLAVIQMLDDEREEAQDNFEKVLNAEIELYGADDQSTLVTLSTLAELQLWLEDYEGSGEHASIWLDSLEGKEGIESTELARALVVYAESKFGTDDFELAAEKLRQIATLEEVDRWIKARAFGIEGLILLAENETEKAESALVKSYNELEAEFDERDSNELWLVERACERVVEFYQDRDDSSEQESEWKTKLDELKTRIDERFQPLGNPE